MLITSSTRVTYSGGNTSGTARIVFLKNHPFDNNKLLIATDSTPFHPVDYNWPDQPSDKGIIIIDDKVIPIDECLIAAINITTNEFLLDKEIKNSKIKRTDNEWYFVVMHVVKSILVNDINLINTKVELNVDSEYRLALSQSHSACHLAAIALNKATAKFWKKTPEYCDSLSNPDFDRYALLSSKIGDKKSVEYYRCGKSLKKSGLDCQLLLKDETLKEIESEMNIQLNEWCSNGVKISIIPSETLLNEVREWHCLFADGKQAVIPCGGTHVSEINQKQKISVLLQKENEQEFKMISRIFGKS